MTDQCILPVAPGTVSPEDRAALREAGVLVIEHPEPTTLRLLMPTMEVDAGDMLLAAMQALSLGNTTGQDEHRTEFVRLLTRALETRHG